MYQLDRSKFIKIEVKHTISGTWVERILLNTFDDGRALCVGANWTDRFYNGGYFETHLWECWREIKEPEWKPFEKNEDLEPYIDCWFRKKHEPLKLYKFNAWDLELSEVCFFEEDSWLSRKYLFDKYEMRVDGKWQPVGYLD